MLLRSLLIILFASPSLALAADHDKQAAEILKTAEVAGGFIVHLGCGDGELTAALRQHDGIQVHGLDHNAEAIQSGRRRLLAENKYGDVSLDVLREKRLPYIENMVNLLVVENDYGLPRSEFTRVLAPLGVLLTQQDGEWKKTVKPWPEEIDEWTHYLHDSSGNAVAHDSRVGPPEHLQWLGSPRWSRHHDRMASMSALVSAKGRLFYIMDEGSRVSIQLPPKWKLICRDAFNGVVLWKRDIPEWQHHLWPLKSGPTQLARRMIATGDRVYVTLGFEAPLLALDAATGKTVTSFKKTKTTEEALEDNGILFLVVNKEAHELRDFAPKLNTGDQGRVAKEYRWNEKPREIVAISADTESELWRKETVIAPLSLTADADRVLYHDGEKLVCADRITGDEQWSTEPVKRRPNVTFNFGPRLLIYKDVVLFAGGDRKMHAYNKKTGKELWSAPHAQSGYQSPEDLLVVNGLVWSAATTRTSDPGIYTGRDPHTGEVKVEFPPNVSTYWFHHRCYIAKATDKFLIPSRTGIEFVDIEKQSWDINHWVRGGCLYGVMPCNGLLYAPPHDCACYPEAKIYGFNALAPATKSREVARAVDDTARLVKGPAYAEALSSDGIGDADWPTYRHNNTRSGSTPAAVSTKLKSGWEQRLGGRLTALTSAEGKLFVAQIDRHTVHALDAATGKKLWAFTTGGRVDSPPTFADGRVVFGSCDGSVYCLRAADGALIWRFRAAPRDERLMSFEQLESVWPVHGSVMVQNGSVYCVAGRSNFLDGGLRFLRLNLETGAKVAESIIDGKEPGSDKDLQDRIQVLNMPVGLPDVLSSDGKNIYMRSQQFDENGVRLALGPHSGVPQQQGSVQRGDTAHLFSPTGFLDGSWFHRAYWVYGRSFAGGHSGYHQAGKFAPAGRIMVNDDKYAYGYGRKPQYYRWTTTMEHQLFQADRMPPEVPDGALARRGQGSMVRFEKKPSLNVAGKEFTVSAWANAAGNGVVVARGGPQDGFALAVKQGRPQFHVRIGGELFTATGRQTITGKWAHLAGVLSANKQAVLYVNGKAAASVKTPGPITTDPKQAMEIGADDGGSAGDYKSPATFTGAIDEVQLYHAALTADEVMSLRENPGKTLADKNLVVSCNFDDGKAQDASGKKNHGKAQGVRVVDGRTGKAFRFRARGGRGTGTIVKHRWEHDIPIFATAMVLAGDQLLVAGPPDVLDEEKTFQRITEKDFTVNETLLEQEDALSGKLGGKLLVYNKDDGKPDGNLDLPSLPVWDGMITSQGRVFVATKDGRVLSYGGE